MRLLASRPYTAALPPRPSPALPTPLPGRHVTVSSWAAVSRARHDQPVAAVDEQITARTTLLNTRSGNRSNRIHTRR